MLFDMTTLGSFYAIRINPYGQAWLQEYVDGELQRTIAKIDIPPRPETYYRWYKLIVNCRDTRVECSVDDQLLYAGDLDRSARAGLGIGIAGSLGKMAFLGFKVVRGCEPVLPSSVTLDVPQIWQGHGAFCGPACVSMIYRFYDIPGPYSPLIIGEDIARQNGFLCIDAEGVFHSDQYGGTGVNPMAWYMSSAGVTSIVHRKVDTTAEDVELIVRFLKENLADGRPAICHLRSHYVVVRGYDDEHGVFHINDPSGGQIGMSYDEFLERWNNPNPYLHYYMYVFNYWDKSLRTKWDAVQYYRLDGSLIEEGPVSDFQINRPTTVPICSGCLTFAAECFLLGSQVPQSIGNHLTWQVDGNGWFEGNVLYCQDQNMPFSAIVTAVYDYNDHQLERSNTFEFFEPQVDLTGDGDIDFEDYAKLSAVWLTVEPSMDIAPGDAWDGMIDMWDLQCFMRQWLHREED